MRGGLRIVAGLLGSATLATLAASSAWAVVGAASPGDRYADAVVMVLTRGPEGAGFCSGVALSPRLVLTAAHCARSPADMRVHFKDAAGLAVFVEVAAAKIHPGYRADAPKRRLASIDLALLRLATPLPDRFSGAVLASGAGPGVGDELALAGYGVAREGAPLTGGTLRVAQLKASAPASKILLWASGAAGAGACAGDSGAPLYSGDGSTVLAIVAWTSGAPGRQCGALTQGALVAPQRGWIDQARRGWGE